MTLDPQLEAKLYELLGNEGARRLLHVFLSNIKSLTVEFKQPDEEDPEEVLGNPPPPELANGNNHSEEGPR
jgi:hypothetical protein